MTSTKNRSVLWVAMGEPDRASSRLRVHAWKPFLDRGGIRLEIVTYHDFGGGQGTGTLRRRSPRLSAALAAPALWKDIATRAQSLDWVIFQEVLPPVRLLKQLHAAGTRIGYDFSDPVHLANGPSHGFHHRVIHNVTTLPRFRAMIAAAEWSLIENDLLEELVRSLGGAPVVMRGPVNTDAYIPGNRAGRERPLVGWAGSNGTLPLMKPILGVLEGLASGGLDFDLHLFGVTADVSVPGIRTQVTPWSADAEPNVVGEFDVGLNYMPMTPWTRYRGGAKLIFYQACGVPTVTSPSGIGDQVVLEGRTGLVASNPREWAEALTRLVTDRVLRERLGAQAREVAVSNYSYGAYLPKVLELLT